MKKKKVYFRPRKFKKSGDKPLTKLDLYNAEHFMDDMYVLKDLPAVKVSTRAWIESRRYELQYRANKYEVNFGSFLIDREVHFIHQAPFIIDGDIFFADFYVPSRRIVFEIDGISHITGFAKSCDQKRDKAFLSYGIKTVRIKNEDIEDKKKLIKILKDNYITYKSKLVKLSLTLENNNNDKPTKT